MNLDAPICKLEDRAGFKQSQEAGERCLDMGSILKTQNNERFTMSLLTTHKLPIIAQIEDSDTTWTVERNCDRTVLLISTDKISGERYDQWGPMNLSEAFVKFALCAIDERDFIGNAQELRNSIVSNVKGIRPKNSITVSIHAVNQ